MDHYKSIQIKCSADATILKRFVEKGQFYDYIMRLNVEFDAVRVQILRKDDRPPLNKTIALVLAKEGRRGIMITAHTVKSSALVSKTNSTRSFGSKQCKKTLDKPPHLANTTRIPYGVRTARNIIAPRKIIGN